MTEPSQDPPLDAGGLTHLDGRGRPRMVDVSAKKATARLARARATVRLTADLRRRLLGGELAQGEPLTVARVAGIQAAKETSRLIPLCHPLALSHVEVGFEPLDDDGLTILTEARSTGPTGVEMEALTAASVAALVLYDMVKAVFRGAAIERVELLHKSGGRSGSWDRPGAGEQP